MSWLWLLLLCPLGVSVLVVLIVRGGGLRRYVWRDVDGG